MTQLEKAAKHWAEWNRKEITGNEFASEFHRLFPRLTKETWKKSMLKRKILNEMVV